MQLYLIRHPRPAVPAGICYGASDLALAEDPAPLAAQLRARLPTRIAVASSPLQRCRALAELLHPTPRIDPRLAEMSFGAWEMRPWESLDRALLDAWAADPVGFVPPGGESAGALQQRALAAVAALAAAGLAAAAVVTHSGVIRSLVAHAEALPEARWLEVRVDFGALLRLDIDA